MKKILKILLKYVLAPIALLLLVTIIGALTYRAYLQNQAPPQAAINSPDGIDSLEKVMLGGVEQEISIRGWNKTNPVLLLLHGGPGNAEIAIGRYLDQELQKRFVVVRWDQRGSGKSFSPDTSPESMNVDQFISDTRDLAEFLTKRFEVPKIYLAGHSWGSVLGARTASRYPEFFYAFVGVGQFVESGENERISYQYTLDQAKRPGNERALKQLTEAGPPPYDGLSELALQRRLLARFHGVWYRDIPNPMLLEATSPDASLRDVYRYVRGQFFSILSMWNDFNGVNLFEQAPRIDAPVYFFLGRHDFNAPPEIALRYFQQLEAPQGKHIVWFEDSGHMIPYEMPEAYADALINIVLKETYPRSAALLP